MQEHYLEETRMRSILGMVVMTIPARYEKGVFRPLQDVSIEEGTVVEVLLPAEAPAKRPPSIADSPFVGIWKDREDMADSVEYIDRLRRQLHG
jgi:predicted DNA-binding antitoxin AbrB/MazE fold protein